MAQEEESSRRLSILKNIWILVFLAGTLGSEVANKRTTIAAPAYPMALVMLLALLGIIVYPLITIVVYASGGLRRDQICGRNSRGDLVWWRPPVEWWKPASTGLLFATHDMFQKVGGRGAVPGALVLVLSKLAIPFSMALSVCMLRLRYTTLHFVALGLLVVGVVGSVWGQLQHATWGEPAAAAFKVSLVALGVVPLALAFVYLERWLKGENKHVFTVTYWAWACLWMAPFTVVLVPVGALFSGQSFGHMWTNLGDGLKCYVLGVDSDVPEDQQAPCCGEASGFWYLAVMFTLLANIAMPMCTKYGSATLLWVVRALCLPIAGLLFASSFIMGENATPGTAPTWVGLVLVTIGVFVFNAKDPEQADCHEPFLDSGTSLQANLR